MNNWVAVDCGIADDPKTHALQRGAGLTRNEAVGAIVRVLGKMRAHAEKGELSHVDDAMLNEWAGYAESHQFAAQFVAHFCDENRKVSAWMKRNGRMIAKGKRDVARMRKYRKKKDIERGKRSRNKSRTVPVATNRVPNPTQPNRSRLGLGGKGGGVAESAKGASASPVEEIVRAVAGSTQIATKEQREAIRAELGLVR